MEGQEKSEYEENFPEYLDWNNAFEVLEKAHELRLKRASINIQDEDIALAIKHLS